LPVLKRRLRCGAPAAFAVCCLLLGACAGSASSLDVAAGEVTHEEFHRLQEEAIVVCMLEAGFNYQPRTYVPSADRPFRDAGFFLEQAPELGYTGTFGGLLANLGNLGQPEGIPDQEVAAYNIALLGEVGLVEEAPVEGCFVAGQSAVESLAVVGGRRGDLETFGEERQRIRATDEFALFERAWVACMRSSGYLGETLDAPGGIRSASALEAFVFAITNQAQDAAGNRMASLLAGVDAEWNKTQEELRPSTADAEWLSLVASTDTELSRILDDEISAASTDADCRQANWQLLQPALSSD